MLFDLPGRSQVSKSQLNSGWESKVEWYMRRVGIGPPTNSESNDWISFRSHQFCQPNLTARLITSRLPMTFNEPPAALWAINLIKTISALWGRVLDPNTDNPARSSSLMNPFRHNGVGQKRKWAGKARLIGCHYVFTFYKWQIFTLNRDLFSEYLLLGVLKIKSHEHSRANNNRLKINANGKKLMKLIRQWVPNEYRKDSMEKRKNSPENSQEQHLLNSSNL